MTVETWSALVGLFVPALIAFVNRSDWKDWIKALVALASSILVGTVTALLGGQFTGSNWVTAVGIVFATSQVAYLTWWKGSGITKKIEKTLNIVPEIESMKSTELERSFKKEEK